MALLKNGKVFYIKCGIKDYTDEYGTNHTLEEYFNWFRQQFINTLNINAEDFWMKWDDNSPFFQLPYINEPHPYAKLVLYLNTSISKTTLLSSISSESISLEVGNADITSVHDTYVSWTSNSIVNNYVYRDEYNGDLVTKETNDYIYLKTNYYTTFIIDTNFLKTHNFYTIGGISNSYKLTECYVAPTILICNIINKFNNEYYDGIIFLWSPSYNTPGGYFPNENSTSYTIFNAPSIKALIPDFDEYENPNDFRTYYVKGFYPQLFTADESSFSIVKIHFGKMRPVSDIYLTKVTNTSLANFCYYQNMLIEKNTWKKFTQIDEFNNKKTFFLGLSSIIQNDIDLKSFSNWIPVIEEKKEKQSEVKGCLKFSSDEDFILAANKNWDGVIEYSIDNGKNWIEWDGSQLIGDKDTNIFLRGTNNSKITGEIRTSYSESSNYKWTFTGKYIKGNIETLLDYNKVQKKEHPLMGDGCYSYMFSECKALKEIPELPAINLSYGCYQGMFAYCSSLIKPPKLPAITLNDRCYQWMFYYCSSLKETPKLPATTLAEYCYFSMFARCDSLTEIPKSLSATTVPFDGYYCMFYGCTSLIKVPELPATTLATDCYRGMFEKCSSLIEAPKLPATTLAPGCYRNMFYGCTSLIEVLELPATTLVNYCYYQMFYNCEKIKISSFQSAEYPYEYRIPKEGTGTTVGYSLSGMFSGTGGTITGTPTINTTYYTSNEVV